MDEINYEDAVQAVYDWQHGEHYYRSQLFDLMCRSDPGNFAKLALVFPVEAKAYKDWYCSPDPDEFFKLHLPHFEVGRKK